MDEAAGRPFLALISQAFAAQGERVPTAILKRRATTEEQPSVFDEDDDEEEPERTRPDRKRPPPPDVSGERTSPGFKLGLMADPLTDSFSTGGSLPRPAREAAPGIRILPPEEAMGPLPPEALLPAAPLLETLPVVVGVLATTTTTAVDATEGGGLSDLEPLDASEETPPFNAAPSVGSAPATPGPAPSAPVVAAQGDGPTAMDAVAPPLEAPEPPSITSSDPLAGILAEPTWEDAFPAWQVPERTIVLDEETLLRVQAEVAGSLAAAIDEGELRTATGSWRVTEALVVESCAAAPPLPEEDEGAGPPREGEAGIAGRFTPTGLVLERPTGGGSSGDLARKAYSIFLSAIEDYRMGHLKAAHTNAMLARVYDPENRAYARAVATWGERLRSEGRRHFAVEATRLNGEPISASG